MRKQLDEFVNRLVAAQQRQAFVGGRHEGQSTPVLILQRAQIEKDTTFDAGQDFVELIENDHQLASQPVEHRGQPLVEAQWHMKRAVGIDECFVCITQRAQQCIGHSLSAQGYLADNARTSS
ncbi:MAG: hypothetical protein IPO15_04880 [Anaerolineae bacterium]|uniref:hypothetical protein n=1 Tax=Candidatus Amarolinea dominans TaxID=3140696 RepID=UPI003136AA76|nr:hypothetical protein [Anaerolineae bacterium]